MPSNANACSAVVAHKVLFFISISPIGRPFCRQKLFEGAIHAPIGASLAWEDGSL
jgi:hypothetical protein